MRKEPVVDADDLYPPHVFKGAVSREEAMDDALGYFEGNAMRATKFLDKYAVSTPEGEYFETTPNDMHLRLAYAFSQVEKAFGGPRQLSEEEIYEHLAMFQELIPNGSPMAAIGNPYQAMSLSNCLVVGNQADSYGGIMTLDEELAQLMKRRAGVGTDISHLRPSGEPVHNAARTSTGAASFMDRFSQTTGEVAQSGRRGALMLTIDIAHPDAEAFIDKKMEDGAVTNANVSVKARDEFIEAALEGETYVQRFPVDASPSEAELTREVDAARIWSKIASNAHDSAEPGLLFWDRIKRESPADEYADVGFDTISTNPCGEVPLADGDSCRLLAMNWFGFVRQKYTGSSYFHEDDFYEAARVAQRLMDDIVEIEIAHVDRIIDKIESDPEPDRIKRREKELWERVRDKAVRGRRTGLGMTGLGDALASLGIRYGSEKSIEKADRIAMLQKHAAYEESVQLAKERGAFPEFDAEKESGNPFLDRLDSERPNIGEEMETHGRRNIAVLSIAPTGTVSLMAQVTSGIENLYEPYYYRKTKVGPEEPDEKVDFIGENGTRWSEWVVFHPRFEDWLEKEGHEVDTQNPDKELLQELYEKSPYHGATVEDVDWTNKVRMQGAIQQHIDHSISVCLAGDETQMVQTEEGLRYIENIASDEEGFHSVDPVTVTNHLGEKVEVDSAYGNGEDEIWEVSLLKKRNIRGTHRHKLLVVTDGWQTRWKRIEDLEEGDWVLSRIGEECFGNSQKTIASVVGSFEPDENTSAKAIDLPRRMTKDLARLLGYIISDGSLSENSVQLSQKENPVAEDFADRLEGQFGISASNTPDDRSGVLSIRGHSRDLVRYFEHLGVSSGASTHNVPEVIFRRAGRQQSAEFIKGLTLDGHVAENGVAPITTASSQLAREVALLLEQFGIEATVHKSQDACEMVSPTNGETYETGECWVVFCTGPDARYFVQQIGFAEPSKQSAAEDIIPGYWEANDGRLYPDFGLREQMSEEVYPNLNSKKSRSAVYAAIRESRFGRDLRASTLKYWADLGLDLPWPVKSENWTVSKVQSVDRTRETVFTYDLEVEEGSSYVVNGVVSHNTTNLPEDISVEKVKEVYRISYEAGCKGSTIYRQGSREGVLNQDSEAQEGVPSTDAPERPEEVPCALHNIRYSGDLWRVVVGFLKDDPYEVFAFKTQGNDDLSRVVDSSGNSFDEGVVRKAGSQHYQLIAPDGHIAVDNITNHAPSDEVRAQTRLISTNLRHGANLKFVVKQLEKAKGSIVSFSNSVAKALAQHLEEGAVSCDECGSENVQFKEGCMTCMECGHSRCS